MLSICATCVFQFAERVRVRRFASDVSSLSLALFVSLVSPFPVVGIRFVRIIVGPAYSFVAFRTRYSESELVAPLTHRGGYPFPYFCIGYPFSSLSRVWSTLPSRVDFYPFSSLRWSP